MVGGVWFTLSLGRKHRADPKWLLPMICKAGGVTKRDVGSIKILDLETRFEISADKAREFGEKATAGTLEKGVRISSASAPNETRSYGKPHYDSAEREGPKRYNPAAAEKVVLEDPSPAAMDERRDYSATRPFILVRGTRGGVRSTPPRRPRRHRARTRADDGSAR